MSEFNTIIQLFEKQVVRSPNAPAITFENESISYGKLNIMANEFAFVLKEKGVLKGAIVGVFLDRSFDLIASILAILKIGASYLPIDLNFPTNRIKYILSDSKVQLLLVSKKTESDVSKFQNCLKKINISFIEKTKPLNGIENPIVNISENDLAYVIYTSGSTGNPKGIAMPHRSTSNLINWQIRQTGIEISELRVLQYAPISFDVSFQEIFSVLCSGATLILISEEKRKNATSLINYIIENKVTRIYVPFVVLNQIAGVTSKDLIPSNLREVVTSGEQLIITPSISNLFQMLPYCTLQNQYGPTESHVVSFYTLGENVKNWAMLPPIGKAIENAQIYLLDSFMQNVSSGSEGEIYLGGDCLALGYLNQPELTLQKFISNPFGKGKLYRTGDLGRISNLGEFEFIGRIDNQVKVRGYRVELGEIEAVLNNHIIVDKGIVITKKSKHFSNKIFAYAVLKSKTIVENPFSELMKYLSEQLPDYMLPSNIFFINSIPLSPTGKIDRSRLPDLSKARPILNTPIVYPSSTIEESIAEVWKDVLQINQIGINDSFFELGGNSLLLAIMHTMLENNLNFKIPITLLFEKSTIKQLAAYFEISDISTKVKEYDKAISASLNEIDRKNIRKNIRDSLNNNK